jgi:hypothetical protein
MIEETISKLETRLKTSSTIPAQSRDELLQLLGTLKQEASELSKTHAADAQRIVGFTEISTREATQPGSDSERLNLQLKNLSASVDGFEESHPQLVQIVNRIAETLANLGI